MKNLKFNNTEYNYVKVANEMPKDLKGNFKSLKAGECLLNSYKIAKQNNEIEMVEGFLITNYKDESIESVGHVWNKFADEYFDLSKDLIPTNKEIICNGYFIAKVYESNKILTEEFIKPGASMYISETETHIIFKTNVKIIEKKLQEFLNKKV